jgi:hypothetical protein
MLHRTILILLFLASAKLVFSLNLKTPPPLHKKFNETGFKYSGFINITELGLGYGKPRTSNGEYPMAELRTINGYQFNYNFTLGAGLGVLVFGNGILLPITLDARIASGEGRNTAILGISAGYALNSALNPIYIFQPSIGLRHYVSEKTAMVLSLGPKMLFQENEKYIKNLTGKNIAFLNLVTLNFGFSF